MQWRFPGIVIFHVWCNNFGKDSFRVGPIHFHFFFQILDHHCGDEKVLAIQQAATPPSQGAYANVQSTIESKYDLRKQLQIFPWHRSSGEKKNTEWVRISQVINMFGRAQVPFKTQRRRTKKKDHTYGIFSK